MPESKLGRRVFIKGVAAAGTVAGGLAVAPAVGAAPAGVAAVGGKGRGAPFASGWASQEPRFVDDIVLPAGFTYDVIASYGDRIGPGKTFGYNNDYLAYFPLDRDRRPRDDDRDDEHKDRAGEEGLLWVNHEYPDPFFLHGNPNPATKTAAQIALEQSVVGGAVVRVRRDRDGKWKLVYDSRYARRITATSPRIKMTGAGIGRTNNPNFADVPAWANGSLANCAGGFTPWGTALSAEENWADYGSAAGFGFGWGPAFTPANNSDYGWVMEVDPYDPSSTPRKHTNLGKIRHENAIVWAREGKQLVVYTGDDARDKFQYKYISRRSYRERNGSRNSELFEDGQLYVAEFAPQSQDEAVLSGTGRWREVEMSPAALVDPDSWVRAQPWFSPAAFQLNRPEDCEIDPFDNSVYIALTNNTGDPHGRIRRIAEEGRDPTALEFTWSDIAIGGETAGRFSSPDNLTFDRFGNLWMVTDVSSGSLNAGAFAWHKNNGMFMIRTEGAEAGTVFRFGSMPNESESTGPFFTPREDTLFLAIQHPGEDTPAKGGVFGQPETYTSWWPRGNKTTGRNPSTPLPSVVAIRRT